MTSIAHIEEKRPEVGEREQQIAEGESLIQVSIITPYEIFLDESVHLLTVPTDRGEMGILRQHMPILVALRPGELRLTRDGEMRSCFVSNGYVQVEPEYVIVVTTAAEWATEIDEGRAQEALARAQARYEDPEVKRLPRRKERAAHAIRRAKMRLKVAQRQRQRNEEQH